MASSSHMAADVDEVDDVAGAASYDGGDGSVALRARLLKLITKHPEGLTARIVGRRLDVEAAQVGELIATLMAEGRVEVLRQRRPDGVDLQLFIPVSAERAEKIKGLNAEEQAVLGLVERSAGTGVWVRSLKNSTKLQQAVLARIVRRLESRKLIKSVTSVAYKNRKMYMGFDIGVWAASLPHSESPLHALSGGGSRQEHTMSLPAQPVCLRRQLRLLQTQTTCIMCIFLTHCPALCAISLRSRAPALSLRTCASLSGSEPSKDITGGVWYNESQLDIELINKIKKAAVAAVSHLSGSATPVQVRWRKLLLRCLEYASRPPKDEAVPAARAPALLPRCSGISPCRGATLQLHLAQTPSRSPLTPTPVSFAHSSCCPPPCTVAGEQPPRRGRRLDRAAAPHRRGAGAGCSRVRGLAGL